MEAEDLCGRERGERQRADVEQQLVETASPRAPLDQRHCQRECECSPRTDDGGARKRADGADRDRPGPLHLDRERLTDADEREDRQQTEDVEAAAHDRHEEAGAGTEDADEADEDRQPAADPEEARTGMGVWTGGRATVDRGRRVGDRDQLAHRLLAVFRQAEQTRGALLGLGQERLL